MNVHPSGAQPVMRCSECNSGQSMILENGLSKDMKLVLVECGVDIKVFKAIWKQRWGKCTILNMKRPIREVIEVKLSELYIFSQNSFANPVENVWE